MAIELKQNIEINNPDLNVLEFYDVTGAYSTVNTGGFGSPNITYANVTRARIKVALYPAQDNPQTLSSGESFVQNVEYIKTLGDSSTIDNKVFTIGDYFVPHTSGLTVPTDDEWETTGYIVIDILPATWLPNSSNNPLYVSLSNLQQVADTIQDGIYTVEYEAYQSVSALPQSAVNENTYIVIGTGTVSYNSNTYRSGEVFTAVNANTITVASGSASVGKLNASNTRDYILVPNIESVLSEMVVLATQSSLNVDEDTQKEAMWMRMIVDATKYQYWSGAINFTYAQTIIEQIGQTATRLRNSLSFNI
jgi:hypothetical protein